MQWRAAAAGDTGGVEGSKHEHAVLAVLARRLLEVNERQIGQRIAGLPVLASDRAADFSGRAVMLAAAGREPARETIRQLITKAGFDEGTDFFCVA